MLENQEIFGMPKTKWFFSKRRDILTIYVMIRKQKNKEKYRKEFKFKSIFNI